MVEADNVIDAQGRRQGMLDVHSPDIQHDWKAELNISSTAGQDVKIPDTAGCIWMKIRYVEITSSMFQYCSHFRLSSCKQGD